jgi:hypothetical protein
MAGAAREYEVYHAARLRRALWSLFLAYCVLLVAPASQVYAQVDAWQDLRSVARAIHRVTRRTSL